MDINKFNKEDPTFCIGKAAEVKVDFGKDNPIVRDGNVYFFVRYERLGNSNKRNHQFSNMPVSTFTYKWNVPEQTINAGV